MKIDFKNRTLKSVPTASCWECDAASELCEILYNISDVCLWNGFKNCSKSGVFNL
jgi:hypothetical protein